MGNSAVKKRLRMEGRISYREGNFDDREFGSGARAGKEYILDGNIKSTSLPSKAFMISQTRPLSRPM